MTSVANSWREEFNLSESTKIRCARDASIRFWPVAIPVFLWLLIAGLSVRASFLTSLVITWICCWGFLTLGAVFGNRFTLQSAVPWMVGPSFCVGSFVLFLVRIVTNRQVFLLSFVVVPILWLAILWQRYHPQKTSDIQPRVGRESTLLEALQLFGLIGLGLAVAFGNWDWTIPVSVMTLFVVVSALRVTTVRIRKYIAYGGIIPIGGLSIYVAKIRDPGWFRQAEGIPYDETILQAISHGLVEWGPLVDPLVRGKNGISAMIYHHLIYFDIGLVELFARIEVYRSLLIAGPIMVAFAISTALLVLVQDWFQQQKWNGQITDFVYLGAATFVLGLTGPGFTSISTHFGVAAVLVAIFLINEVFEGGSAIRQVIAISLASGILAFAKFPYLYIVPLIVGVLGCYDVKKQWKVILSSAGAVILLASLSFISGNNASDRLRFGFMSREKFGGTPGLTKHTLLSFLDILISPISLGISALIVSLLISSSRNRRDYLAYAVVVVVAIVLGSMITASGGGEEYFVHPAQIVTLLALVKLTTEPHLGLKVGLWTLVTCSMTMFSLPQILERLDSKTLSFRNVVSLAVVAVVFGLSRLSHTESRSDTRSMVQRGMGVVVTILMWSTFDNSMQYQYGDGWFGRRTTLNTQEADWYGNQDFRELTVFANSQTARGGVWAFSICRTSLSPDAIDCDGFRPAALIKRQFLALAKKFPGENLSSQRRDDLLLSQSIGVNEPRLVVGELRQRGVTFVLCDRSRVSDAWRHAFERSGAELKFLNEGYALYEL